jgi:histidyl-tRNA synthetase
MVNQKGNSLKLPLRWFSIPRLFRYEKAQKGRLREFFQLNMDILGCNTVAAEVELLAAIVGMLKGFGLKESDFSIQVSSRRLLSELLDSMGVAVGKKPAVYSALDKRAKLGEAEFRNLLGKEGLTAAHIEAVERFFGFKDIAALSAWVREASGPSGAPNTGLEELESLFRSMADLGLGGFLNLDTSIVRGLAYYTGIVFEVYDRAMENRAIAGGGRYDNLLASLGGLPLSGVGFGMGDVVIADILREKGLLPSGRDGADYYLLDVAAQGGGMPRPELLALAAKLRDKGRRTAYSLSGDKFKKQMGQANDMGARKVVFFGSDKAPAGQYEVKDMKSGEQAVLGFEAL